MNSGRIFYLDFLRFIAATGVIVLHVYSRDFFKMPFMYDNWWAGLIGVSLSKWVVPMFVMISGSLFLDLSKRVTIRDILTKYVKRLFVSYVFWYFLYAIILITRSNHLGSNFVFNKEILTPAFHLWFLPMMMGVYLLIPIMRSIVEKKFLLKYSLLLWFIYISISFVLKWEIPQISKLFTSNYVVGYSGFFLLGFYLSSSVITKKQRIIIYLLGVSGVMITMMGCYTLSIINNTTNTTLFEELSPHNVMIAMGIFVFARYNTERLCLSFKKLIGYTRKDLFGIYLVHYIGLMLFNTDALRNIDDHIFILPLISIIVFVFSLFLTKFIRKIPYLKIVVE